MSPRSREVIHQIPAPFGAPGIVPRIGTVDKLGETAGSPDRTERRELRVVRARPCTYQFCEWINEEEGVAIQQGHAYTLNQSPQGILLIMGYSFRPQQLLEVHIHESRWRRSANLYEVQWTKSVHVDSHGCLVLVGCRLVFGPSRYVAF